MNLSLFANRKLVLAFGSKKIVELLFFVFFQSLPEIKYKLNSSASPRICQWDEAKYHLMFG